MMQQLIEIFLRALPKPWMLYTLGPTFFLYCVVAALWVGHLRMARSVKTPYTRKIFHFLVFTAAGVIHILWGLPAVSLFGLIVTACVLYAVCRADGFPFYEAMARPTDRPRRTLFIILPLTTTALGGILSNLLFPAFAFVGYLVCGWGDAIGEPVGARWGKHRYKVPSLVGVPATRSLEGSLAVCVVGSAAAAAGLWAVGFSPGRSLGIGIGCGLVSAGVEAFSNHGLDNLTIQLSASGCAVLLAGAWG